MKTRKTKSGKRTAKRSVRNSKRRSTGKRKTTARKTGMKHATARKWGGKTKRNVKRKTAKRTMKSVKNYKFSTYRSIRRKAA